MIKYHSITEADPILSIRNLKKYYPVRKGLFGFSDQVIKAVDGVTIHIQRGETLGLVGESGSGKTTVGRCVLRAIDPTGGKIIFRPENGQHIDLASASMNEVRKFRPYMHMIFQDPYSSLSPRMTVRDIIAEPLLSNRWENGNREAVNDRVRQAAAYRHCPLAGVEPAAADLRRAGLSPGCFDSGSDHQSVDRLTGTTQPDLPIRCARPERGRAH
jgi:ABC-type glutathione transport system ATPase component